MKGDTLGNFRPSDVITREEMAVTLVRKSGIYTGSATFSIAGEWNAFSKVTYEYLGTHKK